MKKVIILLTISVMMVVVMGSCQANKKCPAYSQNHTETTTNSARS